MHAGTVQDGRRVPFQSWAAGGDRRRRPCGRRPAAARGRGGDRLHEAAAAGGRRPGREEAVAASAGGGRRLGGRRCGRRLSQAATVAAAASQRRPPPVPRAVAASGDRPWHRRRPADQDRCLFLETGDAAGKWGYPDPTYCLLGEVPCMLMGYGIWDAPRDRSGQTPSHATARSRRPATSAPMGTAWGCPGALPVRRSWARL